MADIAVNGARLHYVQSGYGPETIVFAHGLLMSHRMYEQQIEQLKKHYRCIAFDFRGQGHSEVTKTGYDIDTLTQDVAALIEQLHAAPCHFAGLSMGGFVGMRLAIRRPDLLRSLILLNTSAAPESKAKVRQYRLLAFVARWFGLKVVVGRVMPILFGQKFLKDPARAAIRQQWRAHLVSNDRTGVIRATMGVIEREAIYDSLDRIIIPTLIIGGEKDMALPPAKSERIHAAIPRSNLTIIPDCGHSSTIEEPAAVTNAISHFLRRL